MSELKSLSRNLAAVGSIGLRALEYLEAAKLCLEGGADVNATNSQGFTAMHGAANRGFDAMIKLLAGHGATLDAKDKQGRTPMIGHGSQRGHQRRNHWRARRHSASLAQFP